MIINHNINALNAHRNSALNVTATGKSMEKLSSGLRINRAADDAAGLAISETMRGQIRGLTQAQRNAQDGISYIQTMEGALNEVSDMLSRAKELQVQKANGTYSGSDTANIDAEMDALGAEIDNIINNTSFNGKKLGDDVTIQIDDSTGTMTAGGSDTKPAVTGMNNGTDLATVNSNIGLVSTARAKLGAQQNRLEHTSNNLGTTIENLTASESRIRDTDMASEMSKFSSKNIITQASQAMLAQANQLQQSVLSLLR